MEVFALQLLLAVGNGDGLAVRYCLLSVLRVTVKVHVIYLRFFFSFKMILLRRQNVKRKISTRMDRVLIFCEHSVKGRKAPRRKS